MLKVFFDTDNIGMITDTINAEEHSHYPIQLFLSMDEPLKITIADKEVCAQCIAVGQNVPHAFSSQNKAHISAIIETASSFSRSLNERIDGAFADYAVAVKDFSNLQIDWEGKDTTVQKEAVTEDYGIFDTPDDFFPAHPQLYKGLKKFIYDKIGRKIMSKNVAKIRRLGKQS